jgi:RHS repeat-associated protein
MWQYGIGSNVAVRTDANDGQKTTTITIGSYSIVTMPNGRKECRHQVAGNTLVVTDCNDKALVAPGARVVGPTRSVRYMSFDNQGSVNVIMDETGNVMPVEKGGRQAFDPFGHRRKWNWNNIDPGTAMDSDDSLSSKGYTGHEELDELGLVHTPARLYDPYLGRFLSADPTIQHVTYSQSLNRYSYAGNNPLAVRDPSGFSWLSHAFHSIGHFFSHVWHSIEHAIQKSAILRDIITVVLAVVGAFCGGCTTMVIVLINAAASAAWAVMETRIEGGSWSDALKAGCYSALESAAMFEAGSVGNALVSDAHVASGSIGADLIRSVVHGAAGGLVSGIEGHGFRSGFEGAFLGELVSPIAGSSEKLAVSYGANEVTTDAVGDFVNGFTSGVVNKATGGRFEDGFVSGVMSYQFNHNSHNNYKKMEAQNKYQRVTEEGLSAKQNVENAKKAAEFIHEHHKSMQGAGGIISKVGAFAKDVGWTGVKATATDFAVDTFGPEAFAMDQALKMTVPPMLHDVSTFWQNFENQVSAYRHGADEYHLDGNNRIVRGRSDSGY